MHHRYGRWPSTCVTQQRAPPPSHPLTPTMRAFTTAPPNQPLCPRQGLDRTERRMERAPRSTRHATCLSPVRASRSRESTRIAAPPRRLPSPPPLPPTHPLAPSPLHLPTNRRVLAKDSTGRKGEGTRAAMHRDTPCEDPRDPSHGMVCLPQGAPPPVPQSLAKALDALSSQPQRTLAQWKRYATARNDNSNPSNVMINTKPSPRVCFSNHTASATPLAGTGPASWVDIARSSLRHTPTAFFSFFSIFFYYTATD